MFDLFREIGQTLSNNKLRTFLTGIAVAWGIFMLIILVSMSRGVRNSFATQAGKSAPSTMQVYSGNTSKAYKGYKEGRFITMKTSDMEAIRNSPKMTDAEGRKVKDVITSRNIDTAKVETLKDYTSSGLYGVFPGSLNRSGVEMICGRYINQGDIERKRKVLVMERRNAELLFGKAEDAVGQTVTSMGLAWTVVGVFNHRWDRSNYAPFTTVQLLAGGDESVWRMTVEARDLKNEAEAEQITKDLRATLGQLHDFDPEDESAVWIRNDFQSYMKGQSALGYLDIAIWVIGILTMLSGIIGVSNIMFVSVKERTHEIGIRRAIGAKRRSILIQIVTESVVITTMFGYLGIVLGMIVTQAVAFVVDKSENISKAISNPTVDMGIAVKVTAVLIVAGALAGLAPALKATKVKPVEALRDE
ncbi:MAG: ABC transporter permease [Paramuribaculum sp.]|nr:ABC transporter permease [Paramuribaculum sp.]